MNNEGGRDREREEVGRGRERGQKLLRLLSNHHVGIVTRNQKRGMTH